MGIDTILMLLTAHFIGDFILQSDWMAQGKSARFGLNRHMAAHMGAYGICLIPFGLTFAIVNVSAHWLTDAVSSNATKALWQRGQRHWFFVVIGADQLAHYAVLFYTYGKA